MDILLGIRTQNEVLLITSRSLARGISVLKSDDVKVLECNKHTALAFSGEPGDTTNFVEFIRANVRLYGFQNKQELTTHAVASYARKELATSLRSRKPYQVNILVAGHNGTPELHWIDYLGTNVTLPYAAHGYASYYVLSTLDRWWTETLTLEEGLELARKCIDELEKRMPIDFKGCNIHVVDQNGVRLHE
ncbi:proteasome core particle subunit beta 4 [Starmerella bacillaris]|uniref:Proteasome subunit beta n=1 Tax=Starmerella bacillaris TaxID=1247836 RepID=A0AAV5RNZ9_STABA|nr:proteasome core particle subunit beta 4 [Starmerella bacillaris]